MDNLMLALTNNPGAWEGILNGFFSVFKNVGLSVIILTILIKVVISPFEFLQKKGMKKTMAATQLLAPEMQKIKDKCGNNKELYNQKVAELYKRNNINPAAGCGPMFLYFVVSTVIFITFFNCLRGVSTEQITNQYNSLKNVYEISYNYYTEDEPVIVGNKEYKIRADQKELIQNNSEYNVFVTEYENAAADSEIKQNFASAQEYATAKRIEKLCQQAVVDGITLYEKDNQTASTNIEGFTQIKESFLWIKNVYRRDHYNSVFPSAKEYITEAQISFKQTEYLIDASQKDDYKNDNSEVISYERDGKYYVKGYYNNLNGTVITKSAADGESAFVADFNKVTAQINKTYDGWNGYLILVALAVLTMLLSTKLSNIGSKAKNKKGLEVDVAPQKQNKGMTIVFMILFGWIAWSYTATFALYMVTSSLIGIPISIGINYLINAVERKEEIKNEISYSRYKKGDN